jgi:hypothetical protein
MVDVKVEIHFERVFKTNLESYCYRNLLGASVRASEDDFVLYTASDHGGSVRAVF